MPDNRQALRITPPFGYDEVVPLEKTDRVLLPRGSTPDFCRAINAIAVSFSEFAAAGHDYPIVFASSDSGKTFAPVAVLGLSDRQNLFVNSAGDWDASAYVPAFVRRYPFCISKLYEEGKPRSERLVCVARAYVDVQGIALFDAQGNPTAQWQSIEKLLQDYERDLDLTAQMCGIFAKLELFSPFRLEIKQGEATAFAMAGMYRIDETKLVELKATNHKVLVTKGLMGRIYAHFHSLDNFARLYQRAVSQSGEQQKRLRDQIQR